VTAFVGRAAKVATAVGVVCVVAVGNAVAVLVGVGVAGDPLLHPTSDPEATARRPAISANSVTERALCSLCLAWVCGLSNLLSSSGDRGEDTAKPGICQNRS
jgi:hypothetical protein